MARIDWSVLCDLAFLDGQDRLCLIGVVRRFAVPRLPIVLHQVMLVARLADIRPVDDVEIAIAVITPAGITTTPSDPESIVIEVAGEYVLATLRDVPLVQEGVYSFQMALGSQPVVSVEIPVLAIHYSAVADVQ